jgi:hypothetical protein
MRIGPNRTWEDGRLKQGVHMDGETMMTTRGPTWKMVADSLLWRASAGGSGHEDMNEHHGGSITSFRTFGYRRDQRQRPELGFEA